MKGLMIILMLAFSSLGVCGKIAYYKNGKSEVLLGCVMDTQYVSGYTISIYYFKCKSKLKNSMFATERDSMVWVGRSRLVCRLDEFLLESKQRFTMLLDCN